jgi:murein DD-endopeptidase MepM/ murein hydrolase activator NlpD
MRMASDYSVSPRSKCYADEMKFLLPISTATGQRWQPRAFQLAAARRRRICPSLLACFTLFAVLPASAASWTVDARPATLLNGAPVVFEVHAPVNLDSLSGSWLGHQLSFSYNSTTQTWFVLAGVSLETNPGRYTLALIGQRPATEAPLRFTRAFPVARAQYPKIKVQLSVEKKFTEPTPEQQAQIAESVKVKEEYLGRVTPERKWDGSFKAPVDAATSDVFGSQRIFNGVAQRPHLGLDFRVPTGTPVAAMNAGTVLLARFLYFEGNCVVIDHGLGLLTLYFHLSEFKVKEGDSVTRGQEIGLSGGTGRATGPHLHVAVRWEGTSLDPARLLELQLP